MNRTLTEAMIYWDASDPRNEGWAFRLTYSDSHQESGPVDGLADHATHEEIQAAMEAEAGVDIDFGSIAFDDADGGCHTYIAETA